MFDASDVGRPRKRPPMAATPNVSASCGRRSADQSPGISPGRGSCEEAGSRPMAGGSRCVHTHRESAAIWEEWGSNGRRLPICALTSESLAKVKGLVANWDEAGRPTALAAGTRYVHSYRESPVTPDFRGVVSRAGQEDPLRPQAADSPARVARLAARGRDAGGTPGRPPEAPPPRARPPRGFRHGPRAPARQPRWQGAGASRRRKAHPARTRGARFPAPGSWGRGSIARRKSTARVRAG